MLFVQDGQQLGVAEVSAANGRSRLLIGTEQERIASLSTHPGLTINFQP